MNKILVQCSYCPEIVERTHGRKLVACFNCKIKRKRKFSEKYYNNNKKLINQCKKIIKRKAKQENLYIIKHQARNTWVSDLYKTHKNLYTVAKIAKLNTDTVRSILKKEGFTDMYDY